MVFAIFEKRRSFTDLNFSREDKRFYDSIGEDLGCTMPVENLDTWSKCWIPAIPEVGQAQEFPFFPSGDADADDDVAAPSSSL